ncbi:MAG: threonine/serine exporter family protein [Oscillospiraceae bacterium]
MTQSKEQILSIACKLGRGLLENGGEVYRVEESINFFLKAYGIKNAQIFAIPATIIVTIEVDGVPFTQLERVKSISQNMDKMHKINDLCRYACKVKPDLSLIYDKLEDINNLKPYGFYATVLSYGMASAFFCLFWGGNYQDAVVAFAGGVSAKYCLEFMSKVKSNIFFSNVVSGAIIALIAVTGVYSGFAQNIDKVIIGAIMMLVPGVAITNVMRDIIAGDIITGTTKIAEVLLVATSIAIGIALTLSAVAGVMGGAI